MSKGWPLVKLGEVLKQRKEFIIIDDTQEYMRCRVQLHAKGIVLRDRVIGSEIKTKQQQICKAGEFLVAEIDAKVGGFGIVPDELEGAIVSSHYFLFSLNLNKISEKFLDYYAKTPSFKDQVNAKGSTNYAAIRPKDILGYTIPLPPLAEQQRIVAKIERLAGKIEEVKTLKEQAIEKSLLLLSHETTFLIENLSSQTSLVSDLITEPPRNGLSPKPETETNGRPMLRINSVSSSLTRFVDLKAIKYVEVADGEAKPFVLQNNDIFIVRYNGDINRVAKTAIYKSIDECITIFPDKLIRLRPNLEKILPDFLAIALATKSVRKQIEKFGKTTAGNIGISGSNVKSLIVPLPSMQHQSYIVAYLDRLKEKMDKITMAQSQTTAELDALLPSILDKAFKGEL